MPLSYTNRKGQTYFLCQGSTRAGRQRYCFSREPGDIPVSEVPEGYEIRESVNGVVSLAKMRLKVLADAELETVKTAIQAHPKAKNYRVGARSRTVTVYEKSGPDIAALASQFATRLGIAPKTKQRAVARLEEQERTHGHFRPLMRFTLKDAGQRLFSVERMRFSGGADHWIAIEYNKPLPALCASLIPALGTEAYFELI